MTANRKLFAIISLLPVLPELFWVMRNAVREVASSSLIARFGSIVPGTQRLRILHPLIDPRCGQARTDMRQRRPDVALVCLGIDDVASLAGEYLP